MKILNRYIARHILASTVLVLVVLLGIYMFMDFIAELDDLGEGDYALTDILPAAALNVFMNCCLSRPCSAVCWGWGHWPHKVSWW